MKGLSMAGLMCIAGVAYAFAAPAASVAPQESAADECRDARLGATSDVNVVKTGDASREAEQPAALKCSARTAIRGANETMADLLGGDAARAVRSSADSRDVPALTNVGSSTDIGNNCCRVCNDSGRCVTACGERVREICG